MKADSGINSIQGKIQLVLKALLVITITAAVVIEGYYIVSLRDRIDRQTEDLENISMQLRALKNEKASLNKELSSMKKLTGDEKDGNTPDR